MHRNLQEVMTSQSKMLPKRGEEQGAHDAALVASYQKDVEKTKRLLDRRPCFDVLDVDYRAVLDNAAGEAERPHHEAVGGEGRARARLGQARVGEAGLILHALEKTKFPMKLI